MKKEEFEKITSDVCELPKFFTNALFDRIDANKSGNVNRQQFVKYWKQDLEKWDVMKRMFKVIA